MTTKLTPKQKKAIRQERNKQKQQRAAIINKIDWLQHDNCDICPRGLTTSLTSRSHCEGCHAFDKITALGDQLNDLVNEKRSETEFIAANKEIFITKPVTLNPTIKEPKEMSKLTVKKYKDYRAQGLKDKDIAQKEGITISSLYQFKSTNGLSKKQKEKIESPIVEISPKQVEPKWDEVQKSVDAYFEKKTVKEEPKRLTATEEDPERLKMQYEIDSLKRDVQLHKDTASKAVNDLHIYITDYQKLEVDFINSEHKCKTLLEEIEDLKETVQLNHLLMRQQVKFLNRLDNTVAVGEADHTWR